MRPIRPPKAIAPGPEGIRFEDVFEENYSPIFGYLRRRVNEQLAADLTAETFSTALRELRRFDPGRGSVRAWLFGIASNHMRREFRRETRELRAFARSGVDPVGTDPMADADRRVDAMVMRQALAKGLADLGAEDRDALLLLCWGELSYPEIAEAQGVAIGTVKSRISRARRKLRVLLEEREPTPGLKAVEEATGG